MDYDNFINELLDSLWKGTLITTKHDQSSLGTPHSGYRTVVCMSTSEFETFLRGDQFQVEAYTNNNPHHTPGYFTITPNDPSVVIASGVPPLSTTPTTSCDLFVAVSSIKQGWHLFGETRSNINTEMANRKLTYSGVLPQPAKGDGEE
jgi:hypothetical protein